MTGFGDYLVAGVWAGSGPMAGGAEPEPEIRLFLLMFMLLGTLLAIQLRRWLLRHSPRACAVQRAAESAGASAFAIDLLSRRVRLENPENLGLPDVGRGDDLPIGTDFQRIHPDDREELRNGWDRLARGERLDIQVRVQGGEGDWLWFHLGATPGRGRCARRWRAFGVIRHAQNLHQRQECLAEARRLETLGTIAGGIAHEFNNLLTPVRGYLELALHDLPAGTPTYEGLETALGRVIHCAELISQIQAYGRRSLMVLRPVELTELLPAAEEMVAELQSGRPGSVRVIPDWPDRLPEVTLDPLQFKKAFQHLVRNAVEAMPHGGVLQVQAREIEVRASDCGTSREASPGRRVMVRIVDTGIGIPEKYLGHVTDPFFTTHGRAGARGMGLAMVQGMMAQLGGWMDIRSTEGVGTTIRLFFPVCAAATRPAGDRSPGPAVPAAEAGRLLVADDEGFIRDVVRRVFETEHWKVEEAADFHEVIRRFANPHRPPPGMVLLDLVMPGPPAEEAVRTILAARPEARILLMSGYPHDARIAAMTRQPGVAYIAKPFSSRRLLQQVEAMMCGAALPGAATR